MKIIFCTDPLEPRKPDSEYAVEVSAVEALRLEFALINFEALTYDQSPQKAVRQVTPQNHSELGIYRGWMLKPDQYGQLYNALAARGINLINDPMAYRHCHYLPESYSVIESLTPRTVWLGTGRNVSIEQVMELLRPFGSAPVVVKDFVKSQKHYWAEAFYIPAASDRQSVEHVINRFLELQGDDLNEGLVFREFIEFEPLGEHTKSGMPLTKEFRIFWLDGEPLYSLEHWSDMDYAGINPPIDQFRSGAREVKSRFFTMDIAKRVNGTWMIVELGDAQVAGLPENANALKFYSALNEHLSRSKE